MRNAVHSSGVVVMLDEDDVVSGKGARVLVGDEAQKADAAASDADVDAVAEVR